MRDEYDKLEGALRKLGVDSTIEEPATSTASAAITAGPRHRAKHLTSEERHQHQKETALPIDQDDDLELSAEFSTTSSSDPFGDSCGAYPQADNSIGKGQCIPIHCYTATMCIF